MQDMFLCDSAPLNARHVFVSIVAGLLTHSKYSILCFKRFLHSKQGTASRFLIFKGYLDCPVQHVEGICTHLALLRRLLASLVFSSDTSRSGQPKALLHPTCPTNRVFKQEEAGAMFWPLSSAAKELAAQGLSVRHHRWTSGCGAGS